MLKNFILAPMESLIFVLSLLMYAVYRTLSFISVDAHIIIVMIMVIVIALGVDGPLGCSQQLH